MTTATAAAHDPIAELWCEARAWLADALRDLRGPEAVAHIIAGKIRAAIKRQIARLELLLTKLLLIEAVRHPGWSARLPARMRAGGPRSSTARSAPYTEDPADPGTWRVRFALCLPRVRHDRDPRIRDLGPALRVTDIWRENARRALVDRLRRSNPANAQVKSRALARRFEAIRRVIADPTRAIAALARKLAALGKRARAFARRIACASPRRCREPALGNAGGHALYACFKLSNDTS